VDTTIRRGGQGGVDRVRTRRVPPPFGGGGRIAVPPPRRGGGTERCDGVDRRGGRATSPGLVHPGLAGRPRAHVAPPGPRARGACRSTSVV